MYHILCCGSNGSGQLGLGHEEDISDLKECFQNNYSLVDIACGSNHTILLFDNGNAYACGNNTKQLVKGLDSDFEINKANEIYNPQEQSLLCFKQIGDNKLKFKKCGAGWDFTVLVDEINKVYIYGNLKDCGGLGSETIKTSKLTYIYHLENDDIISVNTSLHSVIIIHKSGKIITWGNNKKGQLLGDCDKPSIIWKPTELTFDDIHIGKFNDLNVLQCTMGRDYTIFHLRNKNTAKEYIVMRCKNDRFNILENLCKIIGTKNIIGKIGDTKTFYFQIKNGVKILQIQSMWSSIHIMYCNEYINDGKTYIKSFGNNVFGQLFPGLNNEISHLTVGTEHGIGLSLDKRYVYTWGWGEHGNCGNQHESNSLALLYECHNDKEYVDSIYGGFATTWIVVKR